MRRWPMWTLVAGITLGACAPQTCSPPKPPPPPPSTNACAVAEATPVGSLDAAEAEQAAADAVAEARRDPELLEPTGKTPLLVSTEAPDGSTEVHRVEVDDAEEARDVGRFAAVTDNVVAVEIDYPVYALEAFPPDDELFQAYQWGLKPARSTHGAAWQQATGENVVIAVIDTGVHGAHPDLADKVLPGATTFAGANPRHDWNGHGTHVGGIAGAITNNGIGVAGAAPAVEILPVQVLDATGRGHVSHVVAGIDWVVNQGGEPRADVINLSLGVNYESTSLHGAVKRAWNADVPMVAAAGNDGNVTAPGYAPGVHCTWPAGFPETITAASLAENGTRSSFSNRGPFLDVIAPGGGNGLSGIASTYRNPNTGALTYVSMHGTSMATPFVAAAVAMVIEQCPDQSSSWYRDRIRATAIDVGAPGKDIDHGFGLVNPKGALDAGC